jgi:hypothetical protein
VIFETINAQAIASAAKRTKGSHGPSGGDSDQWKRQLLSFGPTSVALCDAIAAAVRRLCTSAVDPACLEALLASRLLPFEKPRKEGNPDDDADDAPPLTLGVRPIGVGEVLRRIMGKAVMAALRSDIKRPGNDKSLWWPEGRTRDNPPPHD